MKQLIRAPRVSILAGMMNPDLRARSLAAVAFVKRHATIKEIRLSNYVYSGPFLTSNSVKNATY
jgi:hypothetical protein